MKLSLIALVSSLVVLVSAAADAKQQKQPTHCTTVYVLGGTVTTCK